MEQHSMFVQEIITECEIDAPADRVYSVISDFANFYKWTNDIVISGDIKPGGKLSVIVNDPDGSLKLSSVLLQMDKKLILFKHVLAPTLFFCFHRYEIIPISENKTKFINGEIFKGLAVPFVREKKILNNGRIFKDGFNSALKEYVEAL